MQLVEWFLANPVTIVVGVMLLVLFGLVSLMGMPLQLTPEVEIPTISVETYWPGASPQEIEREIIQEQEDELKSVEGLTQLTSQASDGRSEITLEFPVGTDINDALLRVSTKLQQVREYPEEATEPTLSTSNSNGNSIAILILTPRVPEDEQLNQFVKKHPELAAEINKLRNCHNPSLVIYRLKALIERHPECAELMPQSGDVTLYRKYAEDVIESRLERVEGVANVNVIGGRILELQVIVDPQQLAARQLSVNDLQQALREQNHDISAGDLWEGKRKYVIRTMGRFRTPEQVSAVIVARRNDAPVYLRDVAEVKLGYKKPDGFVRRYGAPSMAMSVKRETGANVLQVMAGLREAIAELNAGPLKPRHLQLAQVYDETDYIYAAIDLVRWNIIIGGLLTVGVLLVFLRSGRSTLVIGTAIPVSIIGTFLIMHLLGRSLNVISLAGLAFAVGMLVDNAVVVLENIYSYYQKGMPPLKAAVQGTVEVWGAVVASTLTTLAVFLPVLFVQEEAGQLFRDIALAISAAVGLSLIVSVTLIPVGASKILKRHKKSPHRNGHQLNGHQNNGKARKSWSPFGWLTRPLDICAEWFLSLISKFNAWLQSNVIYRVVCVTVIVSGSIILSFTLLPKVEYLPEGNRNLVYGLLIVPPGYNMDELAALGTQVEEDMRPYWDVDLGSPEAAALGVPPVSDFFFMARKGSVYIGLRSADPFRAGELVPLVKRLADKLPGATVVAKQSSLFEKGMGSGRSIDVEIYGPELTNLVNLGTKITERVAEVLPGAQSRPIPSLDLSSPEIQIVPRYEQSADLGLTVRELGDTVNALVDGAYATDYYHDGEKIDLSIVGQAYVVERTQDLASLPIAASTGDVIMLSQVADDNLRTGPDQVYRRERQRAVTIQVSPPDNMPLESAMQIIQEQIVNPLLNSPDMQGGLYHIHLAGTADKLNAAWTALRGNLLFALIITYLLMAALFESFLQPLVIIVSVPLGAVGGIAALALMNQFVAQPLDVVTMLGFVILIGTVVNNPILIVHQALTLIRESGCSPREAVVESVRTRVRPIFMTTTTTVFGLLPLVLAPGAGSELYRGLGCIVLGGLVVSTLITLFLVPTLFTLMLDLQRLVGGWLFRAVDETEYDEEWSNEPSLAHHRNSLPSPVTSASNGHAETTPSPSSSPADKPPPVTYYIMESWRTCSVLASLDGFYLGEAEDFALPVIA